MKFPSYKNETEKFSQGYSLVAGCDEVGVACLAGPVVACAVVLDPSSVEGRRTKSKWWYRVRDSKTVNEKERRILAEFILDNCLLHAYGVVAHETIDEINIYHASMLAMQHAVESLSDRPSFLFVDGNHPIKNLQVTVQEPVVNGDEKILSISAASILAKVLRDDILTKHHEIYPYYSFNKNKGYPTAFHRAALLEHGPCPIHRKSFLLVKQCMQRSYYNE